MKSPEERAIDVLAANKYMVLATSDEDGPWAAALAYKIIGQGELSFISQRSSRHGATIAKFATVSGVIFDSTVTPENAESIQFVGRCVDVGDDELQIRRVLGVSGACDGSESTEDEVQRIKSDPDKGVYVVHVLEMFVLDQVAWTERQVDARESVNRDVVFAAVVPSASAS